MMENAVEALVCMHVNGRYERMTVSLGDMREDELLVRMVATGVCHTDFNCINGSIPVAFPFVGGHEGAGIVERTGSQIKNIEVGDHVLLSFNYCGTCASCVKGNPAYCSQMWQMNFSGARPDGSKTFSLPNGQYVSSQFFGQSSFAQRAVVKGVSAIKVDKDLPLRVLCALGCGMQTGAGTVLNVLKPEVGVSVAIFGAGAVGIAGVMATLLTPAVKIIVVDILDSKLKIAREMGATHTFNPNRDNVVEEIKNVTGGLGVDSAFDATGQIKVIQDMLECAAPGATVVTVGAPAMGAKLEIEPATWLARGVKYMGAHQGSSVPQQFIPILTQYWRNGRFPVEKLTKEYQYTEIQKAHEDLKAGICVKAVLIW